MWKQVTVVYPSLLWTLCLSKKYASKKRKRFLDGQKFNGNER